MNNNKEKAYEKLKELFLLIGKKNEKFLDAKLKDGSLIRTEDEVIKVGSALKSISEDGALKDVDNGDFTLEDGTVLKVVGGVVKELIAAAEKVEAVEEKKAPEKEVEKVEAVEEKGNEEMQQLIEIVAELSDRLSKLEEKTKTELSEAKIETAKMKKAVEVMSAAPAAEPINKRITIQDILNEEKERVKKQDEKFLTSIPKRKQTVQSIIETNRTNNNNFSKSTHPMNVPVFGGGNMSVEVDKL